MEAGKVETVAKETSGRLWAVSKTSTSFGSTGPPPKASAPLNLAFRSQGCGFPSPAGAGPIDWECWVAWSSLQDANSFCSAGFALVWS